MQILLLLVAGLHMVVDGIRSHLLSKKDQSSEAGRTISPIKCIKFFTMTNFIEPLIGCEGSLSFWKNEKSAVIQRLCKMSYCDGEKNVFQYYINAVKVYLIRS